MRRNSGFTLIELITVMAITAILMTIIFVPVIQGFNLTRAAQAYANAQDRARTLIRQIEREIGNGTAVRDNTGSRGAITVVLRGQNKAPVATTLPAMKLDILKPAEGDPLRGPSGAFINPDTGKEDPTMQSPKGQVLLPATSGISMVRYFVGLRQPVVTSPAGAPTGPGLYNNPYDGLLTKVGGEGTTQDNLYVLYRAEVLTRVWDRTARKYVVNTALFQDANNDDIPDDIDDPAFFALLPGTDFDAALALTGQGTAKANRILNWLKRSVVVTEVSRYDMIAPVYDKATRQVKFTNNVPHLVPLVRFQPTRITSEPAAAQSTVRPGEEASNMAKAGPDMFRTQYGLWSSLLVRTWPSVWPANFAANGDRAGNVRARWDQGGANSPYMIGRSWLDNAGKETFSVFAFDPQSMTNDLTDGVEVFDLTRYGEIRRLPRPDWGANAGATYPYAFTEAVNSANARSNWLSQLGTKLSFVPFVPDTRNGQIIGSFDSREMGVDQAVPYQYRVPTWGQATATGLPPALSTGARVSPYNAGQALDYTPNNDPDVANIANWFDPVFEPVNRRFNKLWHDFPLLAPGLDRAQYVKRFIDLRVSNQPDGSLGPLNPTNKLGRACITPGSEVVIGPDQRPGPNQGKYVQYTRVAQRPVGANQYFINYSDQPEPDYGALGIAFGGAVGNIYDPTDYGPQSFLQAIIQPQYRTGYVELNSRFGEPIPSGYTDASGYHPTGNIFVTYRFQFTEPNDIVAVDYDSNQVMEVNLTIRNYPQTQNIPNPQSITVKGISEVRNFVR